MDRIFYELLIRFIQMYEGTIDADEDDLQALVDEAKARIKLYEDLYMD